jgi:hypothetical protein
MYFFAYKLLIRAFGYTDVDDIRQSHQGHFTSSLILGQGLFKLWSMVTFDLLGFLTEVFEKTARCSVGNYFLEITGILNQLTCFRFKYVCVELLLNS